MNEPDNISGEKLSSVETDNKNKKEKRFSLADTLQFIFLLAVIALIIFIRQMPLFTVDGRSMDHTYADGDLLVGNQKADIKQGDILIIYSDVLSERIVKRCIGLPGDEIKILDNQVYVNGKKLKEDYIAEPMNTEDMTITLSDDEYFVMGDNRNHSTDSRDIGPIPKEKIQAKVTPQVTTFTMDGGYYARIDLNRYMIQYINNRYLDLEIKMNDEAGLKIPKSSILQKE